MGYEQRAREAVEALHVETYKVRRWTALEWKCPEGTDPTEWRREAEDHLKRSAGMIGRALRDKCPDVESSVTQVRVAHTPELLFEVIVRATDEGDARRRAMYRFHRALSVKIPRGGGIRTPLVPPWGEAEVEAV